MLSLINFEVRKHLSARNPLQWVFYVIVSTLFPKQFWNKLTSGVASDFSGLLVFLLSVPSRSVMDLLLPIPQGYPMPNTMQKVLHFLSSEAAQITSKKTILFDTHSLAHFWRNWQENQRFLWKRDEASTPFSKIWRSLLSSAFMPLSKLWSLFNDGEFQTSVLFHL